MVLFGTIIWECFINLDEDCSKKFRRILYHIEKSGENFMLWEVF